MTEEDKSSDSSGAISGYKPGLELRRSLYRTYFEKMFEILREPSRLIQALDLSRPKVQVSSVETIPLQEDREGSQSR